MNFHMYSRKKAISILNFKIRVNVHVVGSGLRGFEKEFGGDLSGSGGRRDR